ncbi:hypothetical protein [Cellulomonas edaphi]|uniref:Uncharacterized protein n=1 Tax=Cellulomonas edaphi TaxID=3053468 RepID=A0ABT7S3M9_9CELL|nr:hypothetical protein [Cellulomons edaphi]MDM7830223.1 hypothetical protein [Cellulomons edaphi]
MTTSWFPLDGDPVAVRRASQRYSDVADTIAVAARRLREIAARRRDVAESVEAASRKASDVAERIDRARGRYANAGRALGAYAVRLDAAQGAASAAVRAGRSADVDARDADARAAAARAALEAAPPDEVPARTRELAAAADDQQEARRRVEAARSDLERAAAARDAAARTAAEQIRASLHDGLGDGWWQDWGKTVLTTVAAVADVVANVCGILALIGCWVPGLGELFALAAFLAAAVKLVADIALASADDDVTWGDVVWDAAGLIPGGVGKGVGTMARTTTKVAAGTARREAGRLAARPPHLRPPGVPRTGSSQDVLRGLVGEPPELLSRAGAIEAMTAASGRKAFRDAFDPRVELRAIRDGREIRGSKTLREWWADSKGATFAVRMLGDPELAKDIEAVRSISPTLLAVSPETAAAVRASHTWRRTAAGAYALTSTDAVVGPQDLADWAFGPDDYAPGALHALQSLGNIHGDGDARRVLHLPAVGP